MNQVFGADGVFQIEEKQTCLTGIYAVVVIYKLLPDESTTMRTLRQAAETAAKAQLRLRIAIYDNTPGGQVVDSLPGGVRYTALPQNPGLAVAYNDAMRAAHEEGFEWLLTLDQDTDLPPDFLTLLLRAIAEYRGDTRVGAIVPHIVDNGRPLSPFRFVGGFFPSVMPVGFGGIAGPFTSALNSASLLRVKTLEQVGGYDERFPLNNSDTSLFHKLGEGGKLVAVAGDITVQHELAIMNRQERMTLTRYRQLLADERAFWDLKMGFWGRVERLLRLIGRAVKDWLRGEHREFRGATLAEIRYRLFTRRKARIKAWQQSFLV